MRTVVLTIALSAVCAAACASSTPMQRQLDAQRVNAAGAQKVGELPVVAAKPVTLATLAERAVRESSGLVASRRNPGIFWTHNDSGDGPFVYALDREGRARGVWRVGGAQAIDWEDIAAGPGPEQGEPYLYAGDIGDNDREREFITVYRFPEPHIVPYIAGADGSRPRDTPPAEAIRLKYPDGAHNAEALLVHPRTGDLYIVTKAADSAVVYKLSPPFSTDGFNTLARVAVLKGPDFFGALVTGGDISSDGRRVALCDYAQGYELTLPEGAKSFDDIWTQKPTVIPLGMRLQGEAIAYSLDGAALLATSEKTPTPLIEVVLPRRPNENRKE